MFLVLFYREDFMDDINMDDINVSQHYTGTGTVLSSSSPPSFTEKSSR